MERRRSERARPAFSGHGRAFLWSGGSRRRQKGVRSLSRPGSDRRARVCQHDGGIPAPVPAVARQPRVVLGRARQGDQLVPPVAERVRRRLRRGGLRVVLGRAAERLVQLRRPSPGHARRPDGDHLGPGRSGGVPAYLLPGAEAQRLPDRERAAGPRHPPRRPRLRLHGDDAGARLHDARLCPDRRGALGRVRRLQLGGAARPDRGRALPDGGDGQRRVARGQAHPAQEDSRPRDRGDVAGRDRAGGPSHGQRCPDAAGSGPLARGRDAQAAFDLHQRMDGGGGPAVRPLHLRQHRQAEGPDAHDRRLPRVRCVHASSGLRLPPGRGLLLRGRRRLDHRPQLHRLRSARERRDHRALRVHSRLSRCRSLLAHRRRPRSQHPLHGPDRIARPRPRR